MYQQEHKFLSNVVEEVNRLKSTRGMSPFLILFAFQSGQSITVESPF